MPEFASHAEKPTPKPDAAKIHITPTDPKDKPPVDSMGRPIAGRGRPPKSGVKKPPRLTWSDFEKDPLCMATDKLLKEFLFNGVILKNRTQKITDTKVGSALMYSLYYYTDYKPDHPLMVLMVAGLGTGTQLMKCLKSPKLKEEEKEKPAEKPAEKPKADEVKK